ncbi:toll/interleukin-1 receptor domain-containing protein [Streptomyces sp. NPDC096030]|uniref:toll/interleukin-1 receptor domain-containing protein n=1 Tax=Streptomyces sp. NPDC096030 TaxID=3155423 RepID=UPI0033224D15
MGGIFVNYRRGHHSVRVGELHDRLARHFGEEQVFLDAASITAGDRYPDALLDRLTDCEVLLVVIHAGWADERSETGARRLGREGDWVRREIELALRLGTTVVPILLDGATAPRPEDLPEGMRDLAHRQAQPLRAGAWSADMQQLTAMLERRVTRTWHPIPSGHVDRACSRPGRWLGLVTALSVTALVLTKLGFAVDDTGRLPGVMPIGFAAVGWSVLMMCGLLAAGLVVHGLFRGSIQAWERELHSVRHETLVRRTYPAAVALVLVALLGAFRASEHGILLSGVLLVVVVLAVVRTAAASIQATKKDEDEWVRWPQALPMPVSRPVLRRAIARLDARTRLWSSPLTREQREKASWVLDDIDRALAGLAEQAKRPRLTWLTQDHPWLFSLYALWVTLNVVLTTAPALSSGVMSGAVNWHAYALPAVAALLSFALAGGTMELCHRRHLWQCRSMLAEAAEQRQMLAKRVTALSSPARVKPSVPAPRPEELREPT